MYKRARAAAPLALALAGLALGCAVYSPRRPPPGTTLIGVASWYGPGFHGRRTANGEIYDMHRLTAAHKTLPFDTLLEVRNLENGRSVLVRVNDRGPHVKRRILDVSYAAAQELGMMGSGITRVELRILRYDAVTADSPRYTVQVGAFGEAERAAALCEELRGRYPEAEVSEDGAWHRVRVGAFARRAEAEGLRRELLELGLPALVVAVR
ncbi:MAG TPA: septal ring lytic transglycosylase RlpA family protein [Thermoanaerobaculia bacterium]|nr:septal ring lytic transglycosylase RlpA family protein [Thermoanaerobaculia bacterium]